MKPGDEFVSDDGRRFVLTGRVAEQGKPGCCNAHCTQINGTCVGWHCSVCGKPSSSQGHERCREAT